MRRWRRAVVRNWLMRAAPASTTRSTPQTADSSMATPSGSRPWAPKYAICTVVPFCRMKISRSSRITAKKPIATQSPLILVRFS